MATTRSEHLSDDQILIEWRIDGLKSLFESPKQVNSPILCTFKSSNWSLTFQTQGGEEKSPNSCSLSLHSTYRSHQAYSYAFSTIVHIQTLDRKHLLATRAHAHHTCSYAGTPHYHTTDKLCSLNFPNMAHRDAFKNETDNAVWVSVMISTQTAMIRPPLRYSSLSLFKGIAAVLDDPVGSDVAFVIKGKGRNKIVYAYSNILIARSQHLKDVLTGPWQESQLQALKTDSHLAQGNNEPEEVVKESDTPSSIATLLEDSDAEVDEKPSPRVRRPSNKSGFPPALKRQVAITGCSYITFRALVEYLLTDDVVLGPLLSEYMTDGSAESLTLDPVLASDPDEGLLQSLRAAHAKRADLVDPFHGVALSRCSPKSLYALADRYDLTELKERCLKKILASISEKNILWEILSPFAATYTAVLTAEAKLLRDTGQSFQNQSSRRCISTLTLDSSGPLCLTMSD